MLGILNNEEIDALLHEQTTGRLACYADGRIYLVPISYIYDGNFIIGQTIEGTKVSIMRKNPNVCFEADRVTDIFNWQSVVVQGIYEELQGDEAANAFKMLYEKLFHGVDSSWVHPHKRDASVHKREVDLGSVIVYRIRITEKTGRFEKR